MGRQDAKTCGPREGAFFILAVAAQESVAAGNVAGQEDEKELLIARKLLLG
jgi:hypothetical protein